MTWSSDAALAKRDYKDTAERSAFRAGYSDGFHAYAMWAGNERNHYPNAYCAGYWEGAGDRK